MLLTPAQIKPKSFESRRNSFFTWGGCVSCLRACLGADCFYLPEGADRVSGQMRGDQECLFSGVIKSGRVWRKVPESDARNVVPNSARIGYATERALALYLRAAVYRRCQCSLKGLGSNKTVEAT